jgi:N-acetylglucosaminyl-diphospho-decaprenol L-rhamnosyltransferase
MTDSPGIRVETGSVFVVIVNYRTGRFVVDCLASLAAQISDLRGGRVIVVDNDSGDDSLTVIAGAIATRQWSHWAEVIALPRNGGFAYGNNAAIGRARQLAPDFRAVILLNPDTLARAGVVARLIGHLDAYPDAGIAGAAIDNEVGERAISAHAMPTPLGELEGAAELGVLSRLLRRYAVSPPPRDVSHACDWVSGACMAIRREVLDAIGPFDERFFLYYEEVDFCRRAARAGWSCWFVADARVVHFEGASTRIREPRRRLPAYWFASRRRFFLKSYGVLGLLAADVLRCVGRASLLLRRTLGVGGRQSVASEPLRATRDLVASDLRALVAGEWRRIVLERHAVHS